MNIDTTFLGFGAPSLVKTALRNPEQVQRAEHVIANHVQALVGQESRYRRNFLQRLSELPKEHVNADAHQVVDVSYFTTKSISGKTSIKIFESSDQSADGVRNIDGGKLEANKPFCVSAIQILYGVHGTSGGTDPSNIDFAAIDKAVRNGSITFKVNGGRAVLEKDSMELFRTPTNELVGLYNLASPKMILPGSAMEMLIEWKTAAATDSFIKVVLIGAGLNKA